MFKNLWVILIFPIAIGISFSSCYKDIDDPKHLYTFTGVLVGQYIDSIPELSEFDSLITRTGVRGLLNAYGEYTCFAPTNDAMYAFYASKGRSSLNEFPTDSLKTIAYDHLIKNYIVSHVNFTNGRLSQLTMSGRYISILFASENIYVNKTSKIIEKDIIVTNGVIHKIDKVLDPVRTGLAEVVSQDSTFGLFYESLVETGLVDSLLPTIDENYSITDKRAQELELAAKGGVADFRIAPRTRKYGFTLLMESNETLRKNNIENLDDMKAFAANIYDEIYPENAGITDVKNRSNSLNRFVAYHIINKELSYNKFILDYDTYHMYKTVDMYEYIEPMCPNTLIEVKISRATNQSNLFNYIEATAECVQIVSSNYDNDALNGVYHEINNMLVYSKLLDDEISSKRLRFDLASMFPELTNNNMRGRPSDNLDLYRHALPPDYIDRIVCNNENTVIGYTTPNDKLMCFQGDEFFVNAMNGNLYDFIITTLPVPAGTYEVRFDYQANGRRGVAQFYVDGIPCGVPVNLNNTGSSVDIGYVTPETVLDDPLGYENDKMMRNFGYMKGPASFKAVNSSWYSGQNARYNNSNLRKILGTYTFPKAGTHQIAVRGLSGGQFQIDFIEFVPTSLLEREDVY